MLLVSFMFSFIVHVSTMKTSFLGFVDCFMLLWLSTERSISYGTNNFARVLFSTLLMRTLRILFAFLVFCSFFCVSYNFLTSCVVFLPFFMFIFSVFSVLRQIKRLAIICWVYRSTCSLSHSLSCFPYFCVNVFTPCMKDDALCVVKQCWNFNFVCNCFLFYFLFHRHCEWDDLNSVAEIGRMSFGNNNPHEVKWHEQFFFGLMLSWWWFIFIYTLFKCLIPDLNVCVADWLDGWFASKWF